MKVLFLGPASSGIYIFLSQEKETLRLETPCDLVSLRNFAPELIVSHGYRHLIKQDVIEEFQGRILNLHISLLPWNRGADPNFWSFFEDSPKGVTIHQVDAGIDTGPILLQEQVDFGQHDTLATSYEKLQEELVSLFVRNWNELRRGGLQALPQPAGGSLHRKRDLIAHLAVLERRGFDTLVAEIAEAGRRHRASLARGGA